MISVIDYGAGNVGSVIRMIEKVGGSARRVSSPADIASAEKLILPGVGAFDYGMGQLTQRGLIEALNEAALQRKIPFLGICLGMQLMCNRSDEGSARGLAWIDADVKKFAFPEGAGVPVPHMSWNVVDIRNPNPLMDNALPRTRYYFVHSYRVTCNDESDIAATATYGGDTFVAAFSRDNLFGAQFHPEKSHRFGMDIMTKFVRLNNDQ